MRLYAVFQEAVYRHDCGGIYDTLEGAIAVADDIAARDRDDHHDYQVVPFTLNQHPSDETFVYTVNRSQALAKRGVTPKARGGAW